MTNDARNSGSCETDRFSHYASMIHCGVETPLAPLEESSNPLGLFETFGWVPDNELLEDENVMDLVLLVTRTSQLKEGSMCCLLLSSPQTRTDDNKDLNSDPLQSLLHRIVSVATNQSLYIKGNSDVHAEIAALAAAARHGFSTQGLTAYITMPPCKRCFAALLLAGVCRIVSRHAASAAVQTVAEQQGIELVIVRDSPLRRERLQALVEQCACRGLEPDETNRSR